LLAVWNLASEHMREHLAKYTLEDIAAISKGEAAWPSPNK
jgi:DNA-binding IscR family transcriptional regulator